MWHADPDAPSRKLPSWDELQAVAERVTAAGGTGLAIKADLTDEDAVEDMVRQVEARFGSLDLLFNNAAGGRSAGPIHHTPVTQLSRKDWRSEEHTSELQSLMRISYAVFCLKKKKTNKQ